MDHPRKYKNNWYRKTISHRRVGVDDRAWLHHKITDPRAMVTTQHAPRTSSSKLLHIAVGMMQSSSPEDRRRFSFTSAREAKPVTPMMKTHSSHNRMASNFLLNPHSAVWRVMRQLEVSPFVTAVPELRAIVCTRGVHPLFTTKKDDQLQHAPE